MKIFIQSIAFTAFVALNSLLPFSTGDDLPNINSITMELIHRALPKSPLYDPSLSPSQLLHNAIRASLNTAPQQSPATQLPEPPITNCGWNYFINFSLGTPPTALLGTIDLATDLTWVQCRPCSTSGPHCQGSAYFLPRKSSTYKTERCNITAPCRPISSGNATCSGKKCCQYSVKYDDGSSSSGDLSSDTITLAGTTLSNFKVYFGCGSLSEGLFSVVGLGEGSASLLGQLRLRKFSYLLVPLTCRNRSGKLTLGGPDVIGVTLPFAQGKKKGAYYVNLQGISVDGEKIGIQGGAAMLVNPRTTLMRLPPPVFKSLKNAVVRAVKLRKVRDQTGIFQLCFAGNENNYGNLRVNISLNFQSGDVMMRTINMFVFLNNTVCLAALPAENGSEAVFGSFAQINFLVGIDLDLRRAVLAQQLEDQRC